MKIIREGVMPETKPKNRVQCDNCGCIFEYDWLDINKTKEIVESAHYSPTITMYKEVVVKETRNIYTYEITSTHCPYCKKYLDVKKECISIKER